MTSQFVIGKAGMVLAARENTQMAKRTFQAAMFSLRVVPGSFIRNLKNGKFELLAYFCSFDLSRLFCFFSWTLGKKYFLPNPEALIVSN